MSDGTDNMNVKKVYNDMIDEEIDLDTPEDVPIEPKVMIQKNQPVDEVHEVFEESGEINVPSPEDSDIKDDEGVELDNMTSQGGVDMGLGQKSNIWEGYNPSDYENLNISPEVSDLFKYITDYTPEVVKINTELKPFIPDYIPAVGEVDAFLKIPRPDGEVEKLGLVTIDEPKLNQSKRAVLDLMLAEHGKIHRKDYKEVHSIENAHKNPREITNWVNNVEKIIENRAAPTVAYSRKMPDIDDLMQAWDPAFESAIEDLELPDEGMNIPVEDMAKYCCALMDIPVHKANKDRNLVESLHVLFSLYSGFKANQHFQGGNNYDGNVVQSMHVG